MTIARRTSGKNEHFHENDPEKNIVSPVNLGREMLVGSRPRPVTTISSRHVERVQGTEEVVTNVKIGDRDGARVCVCPFECVRGRE